MPTQEQPAQRATEQPQFRIDVTLEELRQAQADFAKQRDWDQFHSPRNLLLALVGEVGELAEIFQWKGEVSRGLPELKEKEKEHVGQEMSDVLLYLIRLADVCNVDLAAAATAKIQANAAKYPADKCRGSAAKYTAYTQANTQAEHQEQQRQYQGSAAAAQTVHVAGQSAAGEQGTAHQASLHAVDAATHEPGGVVASNAVEPAPSTLHPTDKRAEEAVSSALQILALPSSAAATVAAVNQLQLPISARNLAPAVASSLPLAVALHIQQIKDHHSRTPTPAQAAAHAEAMMKQEAMEQVHTSQPQASTQGQPQPSETLDQGPATSQQAHPVVSPPVGLFPFPGIPQSMHAQITGEQPSSGAFGNERQQQSITYEQQQQQHLQALAYSHRLHHAQLLAAALQSAAAAHAAAQQAQQQQAQDTGSVPVVKSAASEVTSASVAATGSDEQQTEAEAGAANAVVNNIEARQTQEQQQQQSVQVLETAAGHATSSVLGLAGVTMMLPNLITAGTAGAALPNLTATSSSISAHAVASAAVQSAAASGAGIPGSQGVSTGFPMLGLTLPSSSTQGGSGAITAAAAAGGSDAGVAASARQQMLSPTSSSVPAGGGVNTAGGPSTSYGTVPTSAEAGQKRKRFTEEQKELLTSIAEAAGWSLSAVNQDERDRLQEMHGITKERLQNFFNNRKPRDLKGRRGGAMCTTSGGYGAYTGLTTSGGGGVGLYLTGDTAATGSTAGTGGTSSGVSALLASLSKSVAASPPTSLPLQLFGAASSLEPGYTLSSLLQLQASGLLNPPPAVAPAALPAAATTPSSTQATATGATTTATSLGLLSTPQQQQPLPSAAIPATAMPAPAAAAGTTSGAPAPPLPSPGMMITAGGITIPTALLLQHYQALQQQHLQTAAATLFSSAALASSAAAAAPAPCLPSSGTTQPAAVADMMQHQQQATGEDAARNQEPQVGDRRHIVVEPHAVAQGLACNTQQQGSAQQQQQQEEAPGMNMSNVVPNPTSQGSGNATSQGLHGVASQPGNSTLIQQQDHAASASQLHHHQQQQQQQEDVGRVDSMNLLMSHAQELLNFALSGHMHTHGNAPQHVHQQQQEAPVLHNVPDHVRLESIHSPQQQQPPPPPPDSQQQQQQLQGSTAASDVAVSNVGTSSHDSDHQPVAGPHSTDRAHQAHHAAADPEQRLLPPLRLEDLQGSREGSIGALLAANDAGSAHDDETQVQLRQPTDSSGKVTAGQT